MKNNILNIIYRKEALVALAVAALSASLLPADAYADNRGGAHHRRLVNLVGDRDNFHPGNAADIPRRSTEILKALNVLDTVQGFEPGVDLDVGGADRPVGFTHAFDLPKHAKIKGAVLTIRVTSKDSLFFNDAILLDKGVKNVAQGKPGFPSIPLQYLLGFEPVAGETYTVNINLSHVPVLNSCPSCQPGGHYPEWPDQYVNLLSDLKDGRLNVIVNDDSKVDYSKLTVSYVQYKHRHHGKPE